MYKLSFNFQFNLYKKFNIDIWGYYKNINNFFKYPLLKDNILKFLLEEKLQTKKYKKRRRKVGMLFIYRLDILPKKRKWKKKKKINIKIYNKQLIRAYYINLKYNQFNNFIKKSFKICGDIESIYLFFLECRVVNILYRMNFFYNLFNLKWLIFTFGIIVNKQKITYINYILKIFDFIQIIPMLFKNTIFCLLIKFRLHLIFFNIPRFFIINFNLLFGFIYKLPLMADIAYPCSIDIYQGIDFI